MRYMPAMIAFVLLVLVFMPVSKNEPLGHICGSRNNNYRANSTYHANLLRLSTTLAKNTSSAPNLFAEGSMGLSPDTVYGLALCRGDANASTCSDCIGNAFESAQQVCPSNKHASVFYDMCQVWFSDLDFIHPSYYDNSYFGFAQGMVNTIMDRSNITQPKLPGWDPSNATSITQIVQVLLQETSKPAAYVYLASRYVTGFMDATSMNPPLYSMAQCTPDLGSEDCWACLKYIGQIAMANFTGQQGGRVLSLRCNLRYDTTVFYSGVPICRIAAPVTSTLPPAYYMASASPEHKRRNVLVISVVVALLASIFCFIISYGFIIIRHRKVRASALNKQIMSNFQVGFIRRQEKGKGSMDKTKNAKEDEALVCGLDRRVSEFRVYDFSQVMDATGNFCDRNKLGQRGFGPVYKGRFPDGLEIAVKRLAARSVQGFTEFKNEIELIANLQHTNLVRLLGYCSQGEEKILIYEYLPNKSLDFFIFDPTRKYILSWEKRLAIIEGIAQGMLYLHKHSRLRVIHRDLKASNILLDRKMNPKISDFGLAKIFSTNEETQGNTKRIAGTFGYMAPEYASEGLFSTKSDVFSFGVLILEIVTGKRVSRFNGYGDFINLLGHAWQLWKDGLWLKLVDASLVTECHTTEMMSCINIALLCAQENAADRPTMTHVVAMLTSEGMTLPEPKHPAFFHIRVGNDDVSSAIEQSGPNSITVSAVGGM